MGRFAVAAQIRVRTSSESETETLGPNTGDRASDDALTRGDVVGRYVVLDRIGAGGMGTVYAAYDPDLDRKVGLKLVSSSVRTEERHLRLLREAQALAKLQHPNVVTIHDVGTHDGRVWLAMELVEGRTLSAWRQECPRRWTEILDVLLRAGRGVVAAHAAGLVHRDLKPDNIMVADDGRVRVMDFGLVRAQQTSSVRSLEDAEEEATSSAVSPELSRAGTVVGTPAYMAPEQLSGRAADAMADQFSFCVTFWEALYRARPFAGGSVMEIAVAVLDGRRRPVPRKARVPGWLRAVIERGMAARTEDRFPSMDALLAALERGRKRSRWRLACLAAGVVALAGGGVAAADVVTQRQRVAACEADGASFDETWNDGAREEVRAALLATGASHAETTAEKLMPWLDQWADAWRSARTDACLAATVDERWDRDTVERALWCLDDRRMGFAALVAELDAGDPRVVSVAVPAAANLADAGECTDPDLLSRSPLPPAEQRDDVAAVRAELLRAGALQRTGALNPAVASARGALEQAEAIGWPPLVASAYVRLGRALLGTGAHDEAEVALETAYFTAVTAGAIDVGADAANLLTGVVGGALARPDDGLRWSQHAQVLLQRLSDPAGLLGATHRETRADVLSTAGDHARAMALLDEVIATREASLGSNHPDVAEALNLLAREHAMLGDYAAARPLFERALAIFETVLGPDHPSVARGLGNLANVDRYTGELDSARGLARRALAIQERVLGPDNAAVAGTLNNLAAIEREQGNFEEARAHYERAIVAWEDALGPDHPDVATGLHNFANFHFDQQRYEEAKALHERTLAIWQAALGREHGLVAYALVGLGQVAIEQQRPDEAVALLERAVVLHERAHAPPAELALSRFELARALHAAKQDHPRAVALAEQARDGFRSAGKGNRDEAAAVTAWLAEQDPDSARDE